MKQKFTEYNLRPDVSLRDQIKERKIIESSKRAREARRLTALGLNLQNVQGLSSVRPVMAAPAQRREDYVIVKEWLTREVAEQFPSIQRAEKRESEQHTSFQRNLGMLLSPVARKVAAELPEKLAYKQELRSQALRIMNALYVSDRSAYNLFRTAWFGC